MQVGGILLIIWAVIGFALGSMMFGDIGIAAIIGAIGSLIAGIALLTGHGRMKKLQLQITAMSAQQGGASPTKFDLPPAVEPQA